MKTPNYKTLFLVTLAMLIGCAVGAISRPAATTAQTNPVEHRYQACAAVTLPVVNGARMHDEGQIDTAYRIPPLWHVVGGGNGQMVVCR